MSSSNIILNFNFFLIFFAISIGFTLILSNLFKCIVFHLFILGELFMFTPIPTIAYNFE